MKIAFGANKMQANIDRPWTELGKTIKEARKAKKLTQQNLANFLSVSRYAIYRIEAGTLRPSLKNTKILSDKLEIKLSIILTLSKRLPSEDLKDRESLAFENAVLQWRLKETRGRLLQAEKKLQRLQGMFLATESKLNETIDAISQEVKQWKQSD